ncbi:MAG: serine/threonine-protein phosphatase [Clostridia bacterium]|nr:serine/threonine-protein phosphatase [Clostridia bacterium]
MDALKKYLTKDTKAADTESSTPKVAKVSIATHMGYYRTINEDNYFADELGVSIIDNHTKTADFSLEKRRVFAVCDGMGGEDLGEEASKITAETLQEFSEIMKTSLQSELHELVNKYASEANNRVCKMIKERRVSHSGSTLALVCVDNRYVSVFNIGDSRVYSYRNDLVQVSEDQTLAVRKIKANIYTEEEAKKTNDSHVITSYVGSDSRDVGLKALAYKPIKANDITILLCSDGLTDMCSDEEIQEILSQDSDNPAKLLIEKALENGGEDNVTCIVIKI